MRSTHVLFVAFLSTMIALPAFAGMASVKGSDRTLPATDPAAQPAEASGNLIVVTEDGVPVTQDGRVLLLREGNDREHAMRASGADGGERPTVAVSADEYRQAVDAARTVTKLHGQDVRTSGSVSISSGRVERDDRLGRAIDRSGLIYTRRVVQEGVGGSVLVYEYRVTPAGTKFTYYRDNGNGYAYLRKVDDRDRRHDRFDRRHDRRDRDWTPVMRDRDRYHDGRAGRLIITTED